MNKLRIAILVLPWIPLPPPGYAGTERIVYYLTEGLVKKGHDVTLFSVGESKTSAKSEYIFEKAMGLQENVMQALKSSFYPLLHVANCFEKQDNFEIIHSHAQFLALPFAAVSKTPSLHTFHRVFNFQAQDETDLVAKYSKLNFTSISNSQRIPGINFIATVYNGVDTSLYKPAENPKRNYLFWAGRIIDKKGPEEAIEIAKRLQTPLIMAGKVTEQEYFEKKIKPFIDGKLITHFDDISPEKMVELFQNASLTLVPIKWNEPFGLIPVESMACGTPVVNYANGGVKETMIDGKTGFSVEESKGVEELINKTKQIISLSKEDYKNMCINSRNHVVENFSIEKMADGYEKVYYKILEKKHENSHNR